MGDSSQTVALSFQTFHEFRQRYAWSVSQIPWKTAEGRHGLKVQTANMTALRQRKAKKFSNLGVIDASNQRADQHNAESDLSTGVDRRFFLR